MAAKMTVIIPTIQRTGVILQNLLKVLSDDKAVEEIMVIDNTLSGYECNLPKVNVVIPEENLYVNLAWNYGVNNMNTSFFGLINDDVLVPNNFCSDALEFLLKNKNAGVLGYDTEDIYLYRNPELFNSPPANTKMKPTTLLKTLELQFWGATIFGHKSNYYQIPESMKIYCGDNYLLLKNKQNKKINYQIKNQRIMHYGSMSATTTSRPFIVSDLEEYAKFEPDVLKNEIYRKLKANK